MSSARTIPAGRITSEPASDDVESVRPGDNKQWTVEKDTNPEIMVDLVPAGEEGILLGRVVLQGKDVANIKLYIKTSENGDFEPVSTGQDEEAQVRSGNN